MKHRTRKPLEYETLKQETFGRIDLTRVCCETDIGCDRVGRLRRYYAVRTFVIILSAKRWSMRIQSCTVRYLTPSRSANAFTESDSEKNLSTIWDLNASVYFLVRYSTHNESVVRTLP